MTEIRAERPSEHCLLTKRHYRSSDRGINPIMRQWRKVSCVRPGRFLVFDFPVPLRPPFGEDAFESSLAGSTSG